jgi:GNAT superfamily N-acetyltransferase
MTLRIEVARARDLDTLAAMHDEAVKWLAAKGLDQWQPAPGEEEALRRRVRERLARSIERGECYLLYDGPHAVATITVDNYADPEFWRPEDEPDSALYAHRMVVRRSEAGRDLGAVLIDWAEQLAADRGKKWVRLDARRTNTALHDYYRAHGFTHVRTVCLDHRPSGALFQRPVTSDLR